MPPRNPMAGPMIQASILDPVTDGGQKIIRRRPVRAARPKWAFDGKTRAERLEAERKYARVPITKKVLETSFEAEEDMLILKPAADAPINALVQQKGPVEKSFRDWMMQDVIEKYVPVPFNRRKAVAQQINDSVMYGEANTLTRYNERTGEIETTLHQYPQSRRDYATGTHPTNGAAGTRTYLYGSVGHAKAIAESLGMSYQAYATFCNGVRNDKSVLKDSEKFSGLKYIFNVAANRDLYWHKDWSLLVPAVPANVRVDMTSGLYHPETHV